MCLGVGLLEQLNLTSEPVDLLLIDRGGRLKVKLLDEAQIMFLAVAVTHTDSFRFTSALDTLEVNVKPQRVHRVKA